MVLPTGPKHTTLNDMVAFKCYSSFDQTVSGHQNTAFFLFFTMMAFFFHGKLAYLIAGGQTSQPHPNGGWDLRDISRV